MKVGWIGLGSIGTGMALSALKADHAVTAYARGQGVAEVEAAGARTTRDYAEVASGCEMLGVCVYSDAQLREVLFESDALAALAPGAILAIHTTGAPDLAREIGVAAPQGVAVLDATFSGGPAEARSGTLALMVGGEADALEHARPLLGTYANRIHHVGPLGHGQMLKLINNLLFAANLQNAVEVMRLAEAQGLDRATSAVILQDCSAASFASSLFQHMSIDQLMGVSRAYLTKDVATALASASASGIDTAPFAAVKSFFSHG